MVHQLRLLHFQGLRKVVLCLGYLGEMIQAEIGDGSGTDMEIVIPSTDQRPLAQAVR